MRKLHKDKILELVNTLDMAYGELNKQKGQKFITLCGEMQNFVSSIFEYCEKILGEEHEILVLLKDLYEKLYYISQGNADIKEIQSLVRSIKEMAISLKPDKIEIAFLCYKASMSDALESIYFAAKEDPSCDAYFIPIPYFDRNPDGSFANMYFEGVGCYSDKYELTDWEKYDIEARRPDAIFIMNPYDEFNYVTSVHPDYYSHRLRKFTDCLVYIEYGIPMWVNRDPEALSEQSKRETVIYSAHIHSHYCITYSKEVAHYLDVLFRSRPEIMNSFYKQENIIETRFVPLGSPKFDKVLNSRREEYILPDLWSQKIHGKKIILLNTSLGEFLKSTSEQAQRQGNYATNESEYFIKLRSILDSFRNRDDVIIWWRPHPLFVNTLRSMRPEMLKEYHSIVTDFCAMNNGLYDSTDDLHRAISWSDGMISDESSLVYLYLSTGKPFYIPSITKAIENPDHNTEVDYHAPLSLKIENMRAAKGANVRDWNITIWWDNFMEDSPLTNERFDGYVDRFIDFVLYPEKYPESEEYQALKIQMFRDFVANSDGTAGKSILEFVKKKSGL